MAPPYLSQPEALRVAKERSGITTNILDKIIGDYLDLSAGIEDPVNILHYRPFWVASFIIQQSRVDQALSAANDGISFTQYKIPIQSLVYLQGGYDQKYSLVVPRGFEANLSAVTAMINNRNPPAINAPTGSIIVKNITSSL